MASKDLRRSASGGIVERLDVFCPGWLWMCGRRSRRHGWDVAIRRLGIHGWQVRDDGEVAVHGSKVE
jgi:hypothetical protein